MGVVGSGLQLGNRRSFETEARRNELYTKHAHAPLSLDHTTTRSVILKFIVVIVKDAHVLQRRLRLGVHLRQARQVLKIRRSIEGGE